MEQDDVRLERGSGSPEHGGDAGGYYWDVCVGDDRVGMVYINLIDEPPIGEHASVQIYLNADQLGRGIGRVAYQRACEASSYDEVYAHMSKSNTASRTAAKHAGFVQVHPELRQLVMVWRRDA